MELKNEKMSDDLFYAIQKEVIPQWKTGQDVDFEEAVEYQKSIPEHKRFYKKLDEADAKRVTLTQPRAGVALPELHIALLQFLEQEGQADLLPTTIDSYTRHNLYKEAEIGIEESRKNSTSMLNGFPAVNFGVEVCRKVTSAVQNPVQVRHGTPDARLLTEISIAGGFTSYEGGGISYNVPYCKGISLEKTIYDWQYVDRLIGIYEEAGVRINREPFGPLTGTLVPPSISNSVAVIESLLAAEQGCKHLTVGYGQCGNVVQDVAAIQALRNLTELYLKEYGYDDVAVSTVFHQWMGGFPPDEYKAFGLISWGASTAALAGATKVIVKTPHEAMGIPTKEANVAGLRTTKQMVNMLRDIRLINTVEVNAEAKVIEAEMNSMLKATFDLGKGDWAVGAVRAFESGIIDVPFAPCKFNAGKALPARDNMGAVRFLDYGNLPFTPDLKDFNRSRLQERAKVERREVDFQMVVDDIYAVSEGFLTGRPKGYMSLYR
ncbi:MAG: methylaspartate mutase subunit E [Turicibacter sp.]|nr:methylaspartate mutase subunit E [Turicibacter sp.]